MLEQRRVLEALIVEEEEGVPGVADRWELQWAEQLTERVIAITRSDTQLVGKLRVVELRWESPGIRGDKPKSDQRYKRDEAP